MNAVTSQAQLEKRLQEALTKLEAAQTRLEELEDSSEGPSPYLKTSTAMRFVAAVAAAVYCQQTIASGPVSKLAYTKALRHVHLLMGAGIIGGVASVQMAKQAEGLEKKRLMDFHKGSGFVMLGALFLRIVLRFRSHIPERW